MSTFTVRAPIGAVKALPFAALPHELRRDPRLNTRAVVTAATLLEYARDKASCWPSVGRMAADMRCHAQTVRNGLKALRAAGWIAVREGADNPTGRVIVLAWRGAQSDSRGGAKAIGGGGLAPVRVEASLEEGEEKERPESDDGHGSPSPPAGGAKGEAPPSQEEMELWRGWAAGPDRVLARYGRLALAEAGEVHVEPEPPPCPAPLPEPARCRPEVPRARGATAPECHGLQVPDPLGTGVDRPPGPGVPPAPRAASPWDRGAEVPIVPGTSGPSPRGPRAPRPSRTPGDWNFGALALGLGGALGRESRGL